MPYSVGEHKYIIYGLVDPRTKLVRYVGKSSSGLRRARQHRHQKDGNDYRSDWIAQLKAVGLDFEIVILDITTQDALNELEIWWIAFARCLGWSLTNITDGGEGAFGRVNSEATRKRMSQAAKKRFEDPEQYAKHLEAHRTPEYRELARSIGKAARQRNPGLMLPGNSNVAKRPDVRKKISEAALKRGKRPDVSESLREHYRRNGQSEKQRAYIDSLVNKPRACGTSAGYHKARKDNLAGRASCGPCDKCREAQNAYSRELYARRQSKL